MKLAIDSNLLISGLLLPQSVPGRVLQAWRNGVFAWATCDEQFHEISQVMLRPAILSRVSGGAAQIEKTLREMRAHCLWLRLSHPLPSVCRDARDDFLFALCDQYQLELIVSGDNDVLALKGQYPVITPKMLVDRL